MTERSGIKDHSGRSHSCIDDTTTCARVFDRLDGATSHAWQKVKCRWFDTAIALIASDLLMSLLKSCL